MYTYVWTDIHAFILLHLVYFSLSNSFCGNLVLTDISKVWSAYKCNICNIWTYAYIAYKPAYFCIFSLHIFACLTNAVYIIAYFLHISCILLAYTCIWEAYNCILSAYLIIFLAYSSFEYLTNTGYIIAYFEHVWCI